VVVVCVCVGGVVVVWGACLGENRAGYCVLALRFSPALSQRATGQNWGTSLKIMGAVGWGLWLWGYDDRLAYHYTQLCIGG
jgi:hypothetical protein